jgi:peptidyl-tRNA hydrolase
MELNFTLARKHGTPPFLTYENIVAFATLEEAILAAQIVSPKNYMNELAILKPDKRVYKWVPGPVYKLYCVMSKEALKKMGGSRGKMISQGGHAWLHSVWDAEQRFPEAVAEYRDSESAYKITLTVDTDDELIVLRDAYQNTCGVSLVIDRGYTVFNGVPTMTCLGIGPIREDLIREDLKALKSLQ